MNGPDYIAPGELVASLGEVIDAWPDPAIKGHLKKAYQRVAFPREFVSIADLNGYFTACATLLLNLGPLRREYLATLKAVVETYEKLGKMRGLAIDKELPHDMVSMVVRMIKKGLDDGKISTDLGVPLIAALEGDDETDSGV